MLEEEMRVIASIINEVISNPKNPQIVQEARQKALALCRDFVLPY